MIITKKILFVHIPKAAGTSVRILLKSLQQFESEFKRHPMFGGHDPLFYLQSLNDLSQVYSFSIVRNPYTRTYSFYKQFCQHYLSMMGSCEIKITFNEFLKYARSKGTIYSPISFNHIPHMFYDQLFYIQNDDSEIGVNKVYRFEKIQELKVDLNLDREIPRFNFSSYTENEYLEAYTKQNINLVKDLYYKDFSLLGYSSSFDDSYERVG